MDEKLNWGGTELCWEGGFGRGEGVYNLKKRKDLFVKLNIELDTSVTKKQWPSISILPKS